MKAPNVFSVDNFQAIAEIRFCLSQLADALYHCSQHETEKTLSQHWIKVLNYLKAKYAPPAPKYPREYFIKYIVRQFGIDAFNKLRGTYDLIVTTQSRADEVR